VITDPNLSQPTEAQLRARELADVLVAANAPIRTVPKPEVTQAWLRFGTLTKATPSTKFRAAYGPGKAFNAANAAIERMQLVDEGGALVVEMPKVLKRGAKVGVRFADVEDLPPNETGHVHPDANFFMPVDDELQRYDICVVWLPDNKPSEEKLTNVNVYRKGLSHMADSVFHELLHIWFIHKFPTSGERKELGHSGGRDDEQYAKRLRRFQEQMLALDKALRR
jgi:hypothetical protein